MLAKISQRAQYIFANLTKTIASLVRNSFTLSNNTGIFGRGLTEFNNSLNGSFVTDDHKACPDNDFEIFVCTGKLLFGGYLRSATHCKIYDFAASLAVENSGLIQGKIFPSNVKYCINRENWELAKKLFDELMNNYNK